MNKRTIEITRTKQHINKTRAIGIYINDKKVDTIKDGETKTFELEAEDNQIYVKIDWCKTIPQKISSAENETTKFELGSKLSGLNLFRVFYYSTFKRSEYLYLKRI